MKSINIFDNCKVISNNPRYTVIPNLETDLFELFSRNDKNESEVVIDLLSNEGDLKDFLSLIKSISKKFDSQLNKIYYISKNNTNFIIEGNRRVVASKLLTGKINMPSLDQLTPINSVDDTNYPDYDMDNEEDKTDLKTRKNYNEILKIIENYQKNNHSESLINNNAFEQVFESDEIWKIVYSRHISGNQIGKRSWPRSIYLLGLLNFFSSFKESNENTFEEDIENKLQKKYSSVAADYFQALWIFEVFSIPNPMLTKKQVENEIKKNKVSSLQTNFCFGIFNFILSKTPKYDGYKLISKSSVDKSIFKLDYKETLSKQKIMIIEDEIWTIEKFEKVVVFIFNLFKNKKITTRTNIKNEYDLNDIRGAESILFEENVIANITLENLYEKLEYITSENKHEYINLIDDDISMDERSEINQIIEVSLENIEVMCQIVDTIKYEEEKLKNVLGIFFKTFNKLIKEMQNNLKDNNINVCFYLIRSILELLIYKSIYTDVTLSYDLPKKKSEDISKTIKKIEANRDAIFSHKFKSKEFELYKLFDIFKNRFLIENEAKSFKRFILAINPDISQDKLNKLSNRWTLTSNGDHFNHLSALVHCFHQYYDSSSEIYKDVLNSSKVILELIKNILSF